MGIELHEYGQPILRVLSPLELERQRYIHDIDKEIAEAIRVNGLGYTDARTKYIALEKERLQSFNYI